MALVVRISVEGGDLPPQPIEVVQAVRIDGEPGKVCLYEIRRGNLETDEWERLENIPHHYDKGAISLAQEMLKLIQKG